jgi:3-hydroxyisobutyrate dehydrogenase-like beta-hydroxyacid dehydrogenase
MKIGIIGAGNIGATLARKLAASGHEVKLANSKGADTLRDLARDVGATAVSKEEAMQGVGRSFFRSHLGGIPIPPISSTRCLPTAR